MEGCYTFGATEGKYYTLLFQLFLKPGEVLQHLLVCGRGQKFICCMTKAWFMCVWGEMRVIDGALIICSFYKILTELFLVFLLIVLFYIYIFILLSSKFAISDYKYGAVLLLRM